MRYITICIFGYGCAYMLLSSPDVFHAHPIEALSSELAEVPLERSIGVWTGHLWPTLRPLCLGLAKHWHLPAPLLLDCRSR